MRSQMNAKELANLMREKWLWYGMVDTIISKLLNTLYLGH